MKKTIIMLAAGAALVAGGAIAQTPAAAGSAAKGNSAIKAVHTVNDGAAKPARNSFTQKQAIRHIEKSGYTSVSALTKGDDGIWRGTAMKSGAPVGVALDFKGNVTESAASPQ